MIRYGGINALPSKRAGLVYPIAIDPKINGIRGNRGALRGPQRRRRSFGRSRQMAAGFFGDDERQPCRLAVSGVMAPYRPGRPIRAGYKGSSMRGLCACALRRMGRAEIDFGKLIKKGNQVKVLSGAIPNEGQRINDGPYVLGESEREVVPKTVWKRARHDAGKWGSRTLRELLGSVNFDYAKSPYAVLDTLRTLLRKKPDALIIDFFAGSGTTPPLSSDAQRRRWWASQVCIGHK